tara:strand:- start:323 stop:619 length:297 start_codon:yes stop_codon:yes gene_type:complete
MSDTDKEYYTYNRKDGGTILCYGIRIGARYVKDIKDMTEEEKENGWCFSIACADDEYDIELTTIDVTEERHNSWKKICSILENLNMFKGTTIEQITIG